MLFLYWCKFLREKKIAGTLFCGHYFLRIAKKPVAKNRKTKNPENFSATRYVIRFMQLDPNFQHHFPLFSP